MKGKKSAKVGCKANARFGVWRWILFFALLSFIGWAYETGYMYLCGQGLQDRGFLRLPLCPIYGTSILATYILLGLPDYETGRKGWLLQGVHGRWTRYLMYIGFCFFIPSVAEFLVGLLFDKSLGLRLWDYSGIPLNAFGYVCVPVSLAWALMLFAFMKWLFPPIKNFIGRLPTWLAIPLALVLCVLVGFDLIASIENAI